MDRGPSLSLPAASLHAQVAEEKWVTWDLKRPLEGSCKLQLLKFDAPEAKDTFWHSSAHILGHALEDLSLPDPAEISSTNAAREACLVTPRSVWASTSTGKWVF